MRLLENALIREGCGVELEIVDTDLQDFKPQMVRCCGGSLGVGGG